MNRIELEEKMAKLLGWDDFNLTIENAKKALEEYLIELQRKFGEGDKEAEISQARIDCFIIPGRKTYIAYIGNTNCRGESRSEAEAICKVIIEHAEGK